jgi:glutamine amidotransferase
MITIVDYGMGNLASIQNIIQKMGGKSIITSNPENIFNAEKILLPGVGSFDKAITNLRNKELFYPIVEKAKSGIPMLGICLGMQLLGDNSQEGVQNGLGLVSGIVKKFDFKLGIKIPHMGWNNVHYKAGNPLFAGFKDFEETRFYFVHSYHFVCNNEENAIGKTTYGSEFTCAIQNDNIFGVQFHPEKSHKFGMKLLENYISL